MKARDPGEATLYYCDPEKNTECRKTGCAYLLTTEEGGVCCTTFRRAFARTDSTGKPIERTGIRMYRELISMLSYMHNVICRGKGILPDSDLRGIADGAHNMTRTAPIVERGNGKTETPNDREYLKEAEKIDQQIEEITVFLLHLDIV